MKKKFGIQAVTIKSVIHANAKLISTGVVAKGHRASTGTVLVRVERGTLNHQRVVSKEEIRKAYKFALENNA